MDVAQPMSAGVRGLPQSPSIFGGPSYSMEITDTLLIIGRARFRLRARHHSRNIGEDPRHDDPRRRQDCPCRSGRPEEVRRGLRGQLARGLQGGPGQGRRDDPRLAPHGRVPLERGALDREGGGLRIQRGRGQGDCHIERQGVLREVGEGGGDHRPHRSQEDRGRGHRHDPLQQQRRSGSDRGGPPSGKGFQGVRHRIPSMEAGDPDRHPAGPSPSWPRPGSTSR